MARSDPPRLAILGAGPIGLEAGLYAASLKLPFKIYERGRVAENLQRWGHVRMFTPFGMNTTPLGRAAILHDNPKHGETPEGECLTGKQHSAAYLEPLAKSSTLRDCIRAVALQPRPGKATGVATNLYILSGPFIKT